MKRRKPERTNHKTEVVLAPHKWKEPVLVEDSRGQWYMLEPIKVDDSGKILDTRMRKMPKGWEPEKNQTS